MSNLTFKSRKLTWLGAVIVIFMLFSFHANAQGCVAIRSNGSSCTGLSSHYDSTGWQVNTFYRYFKSFRHYRGTAEQTERVELGSDVRNYSNFVDINVVKHINSRWSMGLTLPFQSIKRTSLYEHDGKTRHATSATGLGDVRLSVYAMLFKPNRWGNLQAGLGVKLPTGDYNYQDWFYKNDTTYSFGAVDQSIQPGDGGTGISLELNGNVNLYKGLGLYGNFYYMSNPRNVNGTSTTRGGTASATALKYRTNVMSCSDQYAVRGGVNYGFHGLFLGVGLRMEGIPAEDLIGGSDGFRRPGYTVGVEPNLAYSWNRYDIQISMPYAIKRNRVQSTSDIQRTKDTGVFTQGDAAFADYSINLGFSVRIGSYGRQMMGMNSAGMSGH